MKIINDMVLFRDLIVQTTVSESTQTLEEATPMQEPKLTDKQKDEKTRQNVIKFISAFLPSNFINELMSDLKDQNLFIRNIDNSDTSNKYHALDGGVTIIDLPSSSAGALSGLIGNFKMYIQVVIKKELSFLEIRLIYLNGHATISEKILLKSIRFGEFHRIE